MTRLEIILSAINDVKVIENSINYSHYKPIDLSVNNKVLLLENLETSTDFENYINNYLQINNAKAGFGGYNEERNLYKRSSIFNDVAADERNVHIGLDLWIAAGTPVLAALDGTVHSFNFNAGLGNYGPTIVLKHTIEGIEFHTLYGHLAAESIEDIEVGTFFCKGEKIATLGNASVNGDYAPHLHFQIIENMEGNFGDYPGVCAKKDLDFFLKNCPDPNILLKIV